MAFNLGQAVVEFRAKGLGGVQGAAQKASKALLTVGKVAALAAAGGLAALTAKAFGTIDALAKTSDKLGIATEDLAGLNHAAELTGAGTRTLEMGLQRMTRRIAQAAQGSGEAVSALEELGLSAAELNTLSPDEQFKRIADAMGAVGGQSDKVRLAFKLFDSEGVNLVNTLALGRDGIEAMIAEAKELGLTLTRDQAAEIEKANDAITRMKGAFVGVGRQLAIGIAPLVEMVADGLMNWTKRIGEFARTVAQVVSFGTQEFGTVFTVAVAQGELAVLQLNNSFHNLVDSVAGAMRQAMLAILDGIVAADKAISSFVTGGDTISPAGIAARNAKGNFRKPADEIIDGKHTDPAAQARAEREAGIAAAQERLAVVLGEVRDRFNAMFGGGNKTEKKEAGKEIAASIAQEIRRSQITSAAEFARNMQIGAFAKSAQTAEKQLKVQQGIEKGVGKVEKAVKNWTPGSAVAG